jgi:endonuclease YncB( thermonuclease family)
VNRQLVEDETILVEKDVSDTDRYGRLLLYVYLQDGTFVNAELVRRGYAVAATYPPDVKYADLFVQLQAEAREAERGLWAQPETMNTPTPASTNASTSTQGEAEAIVQDLSFGVQISHRRRHRRWHFG